MIYKYAYSGVTTPVEIEKTTLRLIRVDQVWSPITNKADLLIGQWDPDYFLYLYNAVGRPWTWYEKNLLSEKELVEFLAGTTGVTMIDNGVPVGMALYGLNYDRSPESMDLLYFGLMNKAIGRGLGKWFLARVTDMMFREHLRVHHIWVETCTLDHPNALRTYRKAGFTIMKTEKLTLDVPIEEVEITLEEEKC